MLSSVQVSQIIQQQNQQFLSSAQYSQMMSAQVYGQGAFGQGGVGSLGASGGGPASAAFPQIPMTANHSGGFRYGQGYSQGYGPGNDIGGRAMAAMGGAGSAALGVGSIASGFIPGVGLAASLPITAAAAAGKHVLGSMVTGAQEQSQVERAMGGMQFFNQGSRSGRGFSRQDASQIGESLRSMQAVPEMLTSMGELTRIMDKVIQTGMMQGVRDPQEFQRKFKATVSTLKDVAKIMNTTMEEAMPLLQEARQSGFYSQGAIRQNMVQRQVVGAVTGMNQAQVSQTQAYGAQIGFQTGGSRATGAKHAMRSAAQVGMANQMGMLSNDEIMELTGKEGAEGIQEMSANFTNMAYRMRNSNVGTVMTVGLAEMKNGKFTGKMDEDLIRRMRSGNMDFGELMSRTHKNIASRGAKISYVAHKQQMHSEMAGQAGIEGLSLMLHGILGDHGFEDTDVKNIVTQRFGMSEREAEQVQEMVKRLPMLNAERALQEGAQSRNIAKQARLGETMSAGAIKKKILKRIENVTTEPFKELGVKMRDSIQSKVDEFLDDLTGQYKAELTQGVSSMLTGAERGNKTAGSHLQSLRQSAGYQYAKGLGNNLGERGHVTAAGLGGLAMLTHPLGWNALAAGQGPSGEEMWQSAKAIGLRTARWMGGEETVGQRHARALQAIRPELLSKGNAEEMIRKGGTVLDTDIGGTGVGFESSAQAKRATEYMKNLEVGKGGKRLAGELEKAAPEEYQKVQSEIDAYMKSGAARKLKSEGGDVYQGLSKHFNRWEWGNEGPTAKLGNLAAKAKGVGTGSSEEMLRAMLNKSDWAEAAGLGSTDYERIMSDSASPAEISRAKKRVEESLQKTSLFTRETRAMDYGEFREATKKGDPMLMHMLLGEGKEPGVLKGDTSPEMKKALDILSSADMKKGGISDAHVKDLEKAGFKKDDIEAIRKDPKRLGEVAKQATMSGSMSAEEKKKTLALLGLEAREGEVITEEEQKKRRGRVQDALGHGELANIRDSHGQGAEAAQAREVLKYTEAFAEDQAGRDKVLGLTGQGPEMQTSAAEALGMAARKLTEMGASGSSKRSQELASQISREAPENLTAASSMYAGWTGRHKKALGKDFGEGKSLTALGFDKKEFGSTDKEDSELWKSLRDRKFKSAEELKSTLAQEAGKYGGAIRPGQKQDSRFAEEAKVADAFTKMGTAIVDGLRTQTDVNKGLAAKLGVS